MTAKLAIRLQNKATFSVEAAENWNPPTPQKIEVRTQRRNQTVFNALLVLFKNTHTLTTRGKIRTRMKEKVNMLILD